MEWGRSAVVSRCIFIDKLSSVRDLGSCGYDL